MRPEADIQRDVVKALRLLGAWAVRVNSGGRRGRIRLADAGTPDVLACVAGRFVGIEVKTQDGKQRPSQVEAQAAIERAGGRYVVVRSVDEAVEAVVEIRAAARKQEAA